MKKIFFLLFLLPLIGFGQSNDATLTGLVNTTIKGKNFSPKYTGDLFQGLIDSKLSRTGNTLTQNLNFDGAYIFGIGQTTPLTGFYLKVNGNIKFLPTVAPSVGQVPTATNVDGTWTWQTPISGNPFSDATALMKDNADATKLFALQLSSITTGTTRTWTVPNYDGTFARIDGTNTFTGVQTFSSAPVVPTGAPLAGGANASSQGYTDAAVAAAGLTAFDATHDGFVANAGVAYKNLYSDGTWVAPGAAGTVFTSNGATSKATWQAVPSGSVTTVGALSPLFTVANPTTTPSFTAVNQNANLFYGGPSTGGAAAPTFRALTAGDVPSVNRIGAIYSETYNGTLGSYTNVGSGTATISGGVLQLSGGSGALMTDYLRRDYYTSLEWNYRKVRFTSTGNSSAEGIGVGFVSRNVFSTSTYGSSMLVTMDLSAGANRGTVYIKSTSNGGSSFSTVATSANKLTYTNGDVIEIYYNVFNSTLQAVVKNVTTGTEVGAIFNGSIVYGVGTIFCNAVVSPVITIIGGTQSVTLDEFGSDYRKQPLVAFLGDSETFGFYSSATNQNWTSQLSARVNGITAKMAATGNGLTDIYNSFNDVILAAPKYAIIMEGLNEGVNLTALGNTVTAGTYAYKMQRIVDLCEANSIIPIFLYSAPLGSSYSNAATVQALIDSYNAFLTSQYGDRYIVIDIATDLKSGGYLSSTYNSGDNLHINSLGQTVLANDVLAGINKALSTNQVPAAGLAGQFQFNIGGVLAASNKVTFDPVNFYFKVGTTSEFLVLGDYSGSGGIPASTALYGSGHGNVYMFADILTATAGSKAGIAYNSSGGVRVALDIAHTASSLGALSIMPAGGTTTFGGSALFPAATTSIPSIRMPHGAAPSSPTNGDFWTTTSGLFGRINGATVAYSASLTPGGSAGDVQTNGGSAFSGSSALTFGSSVLTVTGDVNINALGRGFSIKEGSSGRMGQTTLVSGTKAVTVTSATTSTRCFTELVTPSGTSLTTTYQCVCTSGTITLQANVAAGTINTADGSTLNYILFEPTP